MLRQWLFERLASTAEPAIGAVATQASRMDQWWSRCLPGPCCFCLALSESLCSWCERCFEDLPWNLPACWSCAEPLSQAHCHKAGGYCRRCLEAPAAFQVARVPFRYEAEVATLIQHFKFDASPRAGSLLVELMLAGMRCDGSQLPDALVAVPLHPKRARQRGFDQGSWIARRLAFRLGIPLLTAARARDTPTQRALDRQHRHENLAGAFVVAGQLPHRVALVDDVMTTGATLEALAHGCRAAGAGHVEAWALARTPLFDTRFDAQYLSAR